MTCLRQPVHGVLDSHPVSARLDVQPSRVNWGFVYRHCLTLPNSWFANALAAYDTSKTGHLTPYSLDPEIASGTNEFDGDRRPGSQTRKRGLSFVLLGPIYD